MPGCGPRTGPGRVDGLCRLVHRPLLQPVLRSPSRRWRPPGSASLNCRSVSRDSEAPVTCLLASGQRAGAGFLLQVRQRPEVSPNSREGSCDGPHPLVHRTGGSECRLCLWPVLSAPGPPWPVHYLGHILESDANSSKSRGPHTRAALLFFEENSSVCCLRPCPCRRYFWCFAYFTL